MNSLKDGGKDGGKKEKGKDGKGEEKDEKDEKAGEGDKVVAQQNYIVPNQQPVQQPQQPTNTTDASSKPVSSFNKHTYSSIPESKGKQPKTDVSDSKNAQRAQLAISQDAGLKCSQI